MFEIFKHNLKVIRHSKLMERSEFAKLIDYDIKRLSEVEKGRLNPDIFLVVKLSKLTGLSDEDILYKQLKILSYEFAS